MVNRTIKPSHLIHAFVVQYPVLKNFWLEGPNERRYDLDAVTVFKTFLSLSAAGFWREKDNEDENGIMGYTFSKQCRNHRIGFFLRQFLQTSEEI